MRGLVTVISLWMVGAAVGGAGGVAAPPIEESPAYFPGGVANASGAVGCVRTLAGGIEALDLASGKRLWKSEAPSRALFLGNESALLLEQRNGQLRLCAYEARSGRVMGTWPSPVALPAWASLAEPAAGRRWTTFDVHARRRGDVLEVGYDARQQIALGIPPGRRVEAETGGLMRFDLKSGKVEHHAGEHLGFIPFVEPSLIHVPQSLRFHARAAGSDIMLGGPPPDVQGALVAGDSRIAFERAPNGRDVLVRRWSASTGAEAPPLVLATGADAIWPSLDRGHVLLRRANAQSRFDVYSLASGAHIATLVQPVDIAVIGGRLLWTARSGRDEIALIASEAVSGRRLWRRIVWRDPPLGEPIP